MKKQQKTDSEGFAVLKTRSKTAYSTIDQHRDGNAHPKGYKNRGAFFNRDAPAPQLTDLARKILRGEA